MLKIAITNLGKYNEGYLIYEWLELPFYDEEDFDEVLEKIGINEYFDIKNKKIYLYKNDHSRWLKGDFSEIETFSITKEYIEGINL